jgi:hypothetical protein
MNNEEFQEYIGKNIMRLYPDACDEFGKCVLLEMDSGPGRDNLELIIKLRLREFYLYPSTPNVTHVMQEMDAWLGNLKTVFYPNLHLVTEAYVPRGKNMPNSEDTMGLLIFGGFIFDEDSDPKNVCKNALQMSADRGGTLHA